jgi:beta-lactamase regulating signal transducer with metallopeptidase domain
MMTLTNWITPGTMQSLGWALVHFLWQGTALAALAASAMALFRRPATRYRIGVVALALMLLAPIATFWFYSEQRAGASELVRSLPPVATAWPMAGGDTADSRATQFSPAKSPLAFPWLVQIWLCGVALFSLRSAGGLVLLEGERRRRSAVVPQWVLEICSTLQDSLGIRRAVRYSESVVLQAPAVIGWFRPIVFLPASALTGLSEEQLQLVIAHELAHIQRLDAFVNVFQVCVETLLFYHPAVWWLNRRIRRDREHCCDETAVALCGNAVEYARALTLMEEWRSAPVLAMAANRGPLSERIRHLLGLSSDRENGRKIGFGGSVLFLVTALIAGNALLGIAYPKQIAYTGSGPIQRLLQSAATESQSPSQSTPTQAPAAKPSARQNPQPAEHPMSAQSYIDGMRSAGLTDLSADDLIGLKVQNVTPEYVRAMHDLGLHPDADSLIGMKVQGVTPEYVKQLRALGFNPDVDQIVGMKVQGVTADYVEGLKAVGIQADADEIVGLKVQGVTPEYVRELQASGLKFNADEVVGLKVQGVTAGYVKGLEDLGLRPSTDDVMGMKVQGVTPEYIRSIRELGLNPNADEIIGMKVQGVTADYIKALEAAGFKPDVDEVIAAKVQGITPEFIDIARKHGFQKLSIDKLIQLKHLGILESKAEI